MECLDSVTGHSLQPKAIELANFELFSSGPQKVRVSASERYPSNEWITLEEFVAEDSRNVQRFPITTDVNLYVKFIRVLFSAFFLCIYLEGGEGGNFSHHSMICISSSNS